MQFLLLFAYLGALIAKVMWSTFKNECLLKFDQWQASVRDAYGMFPKFWELSSALYGFHSV